MDLNKFLVWEDSDYNEYTVQCIYRDYHCLWQGEIKKGSTDTSASLQELVNLAQSHWQEAHREDGH